ncbi:MAG: hypothetical protein LBP39_02120, partial [Rickettsiales bacterium]|nr:hypothetical protein [Rickettsiales bacterium]
YELVILKSSNFEEHRKLMKKLQPLANVVPTERYSHYINCGDFMDRGMQSEQMIYMIHYLDKQCKDMRIKPPTLIMGNHELYYIDSCSDLYVVAKGCCTYGYLSAFKRESPMYLEKTQSMEKAVKEAVANKILTLAHSVGTTLFSHVVITKLMVKGLAEALDQIAKERSDATKLTAEEIGKLADKFKELDAKIEGGEPFDENDAKNLAEGLNEFLSMRSEIFKDFTTKPGFGLSCNDNSTDGERQLFEMMNTTTGGITWNRIEDVTKDQLIPGLKYIVGHDTVKIDNVLYNSSIRIPPDFDNKVILADCLRSAGYNNGVTKANYVVANPQILWEEKFALDLTILVKNMDKENSAAGARIACDEYARNLAAKRTAYRTRERIAAGRKESYSKYLEYESIKSRQGQLLDQRRAYSTENIKGGL